MLNLPTPETVSIKTPDGQTIDLGFLASNLLPNLCIPSFIETARNTSGVVPDSWQAIRYYQLAKTGYELTFREGKQLKDPADIDAKTLTVEPVQLNPCQIAEKLTIKQMDLLSPKLNTALTLAVGGWILNRKIDLEVAILSRLVQAASDFQAKLITVDKNATTLETGAHYAVNDLKAFDDAKKAFWSAVINFTRMGLPNAPTQTDQENKFVTGILLNNVLALVSYEFLDLITSDKNLLANQTGYDEIFKNMGVRRFMGVDMLPVQTMPQGVNFILIQTGPYGTFAYNTVADGFRSLVKPHPNWSQHLMAELELKYIAGVVNEQYCFASVTSAFAAHKYDILSVTNHSAVQLSSETNRVNESAVFDKKDNNRTIADVFKLNKKKE